MLAWLPLLLLLLSFLKLRLRCWRCFTLFAAVDVVARPGVGVSPLLVLRPRLQLWLTPLPLLLLSLLPTPLPP